MVSPMQEAEGLILITPELKHLEKGAVVKMIPISWEFTGKEKEDLYTH